MCDKQDIPLCNKEYLLFDNQGGFIARGILDNNGKTPIFYNSTEKDYDIHVICNGATKENME